jgi:hypothetical protein
MPPVAITIQPDAPPAVLVDAWVAFIRAMEAHYDAPVRLAPAEVRTAATWAAALGQAPPAAPVSQRDLAAAR